VPPHLLARHRYPQGPRRGAPPSRSATEGQRRESGPGYARTNTRTRDRAPPAVAGPTNSRGRQRGRVLILAAGVHPDHDDRRIQGFMPER
jgi:hypothetical protein